MSSQHLIYRIDPWTDDRLSRVEKELAHTHANGQVFLRHLRPTIPDLFREAFAAELQNDLLIKRFVQSEAVRAILPELQIPDDLEGIPGLSTLTGFEWEGSLTQLLLAGGAYNSSRLSEDEARSLARGFVDSVVGSDRRDVKVFRTYAPWTEWFCDLIWDYTSIVLNQRHSDWWVFCVTDTD